MGFRRLIAWSMKVSGIQIFFVSSGKMSLTNDKERRNDLATWVKVDVSSVTVLLIEMFHHWDNPGVSPVISQSYLQAAR